MPYTLKTLVSMLLNGANLKHQDSIDSQASLTISQSILFNFKKCASSSSKSRHSLDREPPLPLYIGMMIHTETRSKKTVTDVSLSVSYDRILQLEDKLATAVCEDFRDKGVVVPAQLRCGVFTAGALDNLDHNPSSTTAEGSFHGTGISLFQFPTSSNLGEKQNDITLPSADTKKNHQLPDSFTTVPAMVLKTANVAVPQLSNVSAPKDGDLPVGAFLHWLEHVSQLLEKEKIEKGDTVAWSAFHASMQVSSADVHTTLTQLLPLFHEKAATAAMIKHGMNVIRWSTDFLKDALQNNCTNCVARTVDTDVVAILIGKFQHLTTLCQNANIWIAFGTGKSFTYYHINEIYEDLGTEQSLGLPVFHSFTGCDTTSAFFGRGKKTAWEAWKCYQDVTRAFTFMALNPHTKVDVDAEHFQLLEHFTIVMYDKTSSLERVDEARKEFFCQKGKTMERLPPTQDALLQHVKRVAYQAGIWCTSEQSEQHTPPPEGCIGAGLLKKTVSHGFLCGIRYPHPPRPAVNWLSVAARVKKDVVLGAHAERQIGSAQNSVVVIVRSNFFIFSP